MIEVEHLSKLYGASPAIQDVTFAVEAGEILGFLGPNGAGKTTTMRILTGYLPATSGTARVAGFDVHDDSMAVRQRIGYLPETPPLYPDMTVEGFLHFVARIKGVAAGDRSSRVKVAMRRCNLMEKQRTLICKLSKGFRQRVGIAQAIVHDPPVIILDEPTVGLDPRQMIDVRNLIKSLAGDHTIILSTHILSEVKLTCDRITIINGGQVVATNHPDELVNDLRSGIQYELDIAGATEVATLKLQQLESVASVSIQAQSHEKEDEAEVEESGDNGQRSLLLVQLNPGADDGPLLARTLVEAGLSLYGMQRTQASLEDVFLNLTAAGAGKANRIEEEVDASPVGTETDIEVGAGTDTGAIAQADNADDGEVAVAAVDDERGEDERGGDEGAIAPASQDTVDDTDVAPAIRDTTDDTTDDTASEPVDNSTGDPDIAPAIRDTDDNINNAIKGETDGAIADPSPESSADTDTDTDTNTDTPQQEQP
ncbi:MAG: ABC transporter ATP-binding protein [Leptolyngbyaceae cyanobacterium]